LPAVFYAPTDRHLRRTIALSPPARRAGGLLVHPGGPFWKNRDAGAWSIPKGLVVAGEEPLAAACRELTEETRLIVSGPFIPLGTVQQKGGKLIHAWACEADADETAIVSNTTRIELPRSSGRWIEIPEVDCAAWLPLPLPRQKINSAQVELIDRLQAVLK